jgi:hypothetical protein
LDGDVWLRCTKQLLWSYTIMRTIKQLHWISLAKPGNFKAETAIGDYTLMDLPLGCAASFHSAKVPFRNISDERGVTLEQAKQLCQQDFERRTNEWFASLGPATA